MSFHKRLGKCFNLSFEALEIGANFRFKEIGRQIGVEE